MMLQNLPYHSIHNIPHHFCT